MTTLDLQNKAINTLRFLSADGVQKANSGHPGLPMGAAAMAYTIWTRHLRHSPRNPKWMGRDRFILSGGHGSMLLYSLLHLTGVRPTSRTIAELSPVGQPHARSSRIRLDPRRGSDHRSAWAGICHGVGMAIAAAHLAATFNKPGHEIIDSYIYAIVTDGDLMEGVASEAASLAGHLSLGRSFISTTTTNFH
jgi:transketolase